ncbi:MAG TPA: GtrA family protein [Chloroflexota bacterium]|jgi:dolichol-phosphate mannosyltransferase|nr:GtrA family protein [Chloroflexota bacterium]
MTDRHALGRRAVRFGLVGLGGTVVNLCLLYLFHGLLNWPTLVSVVVAGEVAMLNNFVWNNRWTFGRRDSSLARLARFNLSSLGGLLLTTVTTVVLAGSGVPYLLADLAGVVDGAVCNFAASTLWTWKGDR